MWRPLRSFLETHYSRLTSVSQKLWMSNSKIKMTKTLQKLLDRGGGVKKKLYPTPISSMFSKENEFNPKRKPVYTEGQKRRAHQVGCVLYDTIVQIVNSGQLSPQIAEMAVEIVQVKVIPNFSAVNIYWVASGSDKDEKVQTLLQQHEGALRQILTSYHILGRIPRLTFVRDDSQAQYMQVERLLSTADFGPEFTPSQLTSSIRDNIYCKRSNDHSLSDSNCSAPDPLQHDLHQLSFNNTVNFHDKTLPQAATHEASDLTSCGAELDTKCTNSFDAKEQGMLPSMLQAGFRDDLYGVAHTQLINKVLARKKKTRVQMAATESSPANTPVHLPVMDASSLKTLVGKRREAKGRPLSDYHHLGMQDWTREAFDDANVTEVEDDIDEE